MILHGNIKINFIMITSFKHLSSHITVKKRLGVGDIGTELPHLHPKALKKKIYIYLRTKTELLKYSLGKYVRCLFIYHCKILVDSWRFSRSFIAIMLGLNLFLSNYKTKTCVYK